MDQKHLAAFGLVMLAIVAPSYAVHTSQHTTQESARMVVERRFAAVNRHDLDAVVALYARDAVETSPGFCADRSGPEGARRTYTELFQAYPTITADATTYVVEGNRVAVQFLARARKADGTVLLEVLLANFLTVEQGQITRDDTYFDTKGRPCS
jgi:ketosteroid isomerase-like protein